MLLIGATGAFGSRILNEAVVRGHEGTAVARQPHAIKTSEKHVVVQADAKDVSHLARIAESLDTVVSSMSPRSQTFPIFQTGSLSPAPLPFPKILRCHPYGLALSSMRSMRTSFGRPSTRSPMMFF
jgi:hypothetical protein